MKKYGKLWNKINNLLSNLIASEVVQKVDHYYLQFGNDAPGKLLQRNMDELQKELDNAK